MEFNGVRLQYEELSREIERAIADVLGAGRYILGPAGQAFEEEFAQYCQVSFGVGVASGTDALSIGLQAFGVRAGDEVLVPAVSAPATPMAVAAIGAIPRFVDISPNDFTMAPSAALRCVTGRTRAIVPVHLYGMPARLKELAELGLPILEDAAQAHGSDASWGRAGSFGLAAAFSFYPTKNPGAYGDAGMLVTPDPGVAKNARLLRNYGQRESYAAEIIGQNSRLDEIQAAILRVKLRRLDEWNSRRREIAARYRAAFSPLPLKMQTETGSSNYHLFVVTTSRRDALQDYLRERGVPSLIHYPISLHRQKAFSDFPASHCPNADALCSRVLSLPIHGLLSDVDVERVVEHVTGFF